MQLPASPALEQPEMHVDAMKRRQPTLELHDAVQQTAAFKGVRRDVLVSLGDDGESRQHRITVVAMAIDRVLAVGYLLPHRPSDEFVLRLERPIAISPGVPAMNALHLLQKQDVRGKAMQLVPQLMNHHAPGQVRKAFVNIVSSNSKAHFGSTMAILVAYVSDICPAGRYGCTDAGANS